MRSLSYYLAISLSKGGLAGMIPIKQQPEPADFDRDVRQKGHDWLRKHGIVFDEPPPNPSKLPPLWREYNKHLWEVYGGVCAYLALYFEFVTGAASTDHFIAKSRHAGNAYEWDNYRLTCLSANQHKNKYDDVLDPFTLPQDTFFLALDTGTIYVNPALEKQNKKLADLAMKTIRRLGLDSPNNRTMRQAYFKQYIEFKNAMDISLEAFRAWLKKHNPFVYREMERQDRL